MPRYDNKAELKELGDRQPLGQVTVAWCGVYRAFKVEPENNYYMSKAGSKVTGGNKITKE